MDKIVGDLYVGTFEEACEILDDANSDFSNILTICTDFGRDVRKTSVRQINHKIIPIEDGTDGVITKYLPECLEFIESAKGKILVHCQAGMSRSPSIVYAYLIKSGESPTEAFDILLSTRTVAYPYRGFIEEILQFFKFSKKQIEETLRYIKSGTFGKHW